MWGRASLLKMIGFTINIYTRMLELFGHYYVVAVLIENQLKVH